MVVRLFLALHALAEDALARLPRPARVPAEAGAQRGATLVEYMLLVGAAVGLVLLLNAVLGDEIRNLIENTANLLSDSQQ